MQEIIFMSERFMLSIYDFGRVSDFLTAVFQDMQKDNPRFSIRAWSSKLNIDPGSLSRILKGDSPTIPAQTVTHVCQVLDLNAYETAYFELLAAGRDRLSDSSFEIIRTALKVHQQSGG